MTTTDFTNYVSPLSWRYGSSQMRRIFSEQHKYELWRNIWVALARAQYKAGLVSKVELDDLVAHETDIAIGEILEIEKETHHDVVAAIREFAGKAKIGGGKIHLGATSMDIVDNADAVRISEALRLTEEKLLTLLMTLADLIDAHASHVCMGYTHLQPAEPTTVGYRLALYAQDLLTDLSFLRFVRSEQKGKGMKGAVGTRASYSVIMEGQKGTANFLDESVMDTLGVKGAMITNQVYPRKYDYLVLSLVAGIASSIARFAGDLRLLQSPGIGEWSEPFGKKQVGSSAMPFKRNPVNSEKICSLARFIEVLPTVAIQNATLNYLERTLDDSANKRLIISEGFIALDEILITAQKIVGGLGIHDERIAYNVAQYAPFAATEVLLVKLVKKGANRQDMHELLRTISMESWKAVTEGQANPMSEMLSGNSTILTFLTKNEIRASLDVSHHVGDAPQRAKQLATLIRKEIS
jgi:adenylosuccinate lyase